MKELSREEVGRTPRRIAIYGNPKIGKTRLATSLPWGPLWGDKAVYVAWDSDAADLDPVIPKHRPHLHTVVPAVKPSGAWDPLEEAVEIASHNWQEKGFGTIIWDTMTTTAEDILSAVSTLGLYGKNISVGKPGTKAYLPQPQMGEFGTTQRSILHILNFLFDQPLNVIVLFHAALVEPDDGGETLGGPATVGKAGVRPISGKFNNLFRMAQKKIRIGAGIPPQYETRRVVQTEGEGVWLAGIRSPHAKNPISEVTLTSDCTEFWNTFDQVTKGTIE